jgi:hypothetical protein
MISPPLDMKEKWFAPHTAYSMAKFGMSLVVLGLAGELRPQGIAVNALWPRTVIATAAVQNLLGGDAIMRQARKPEIVADAAYAIFATPARELTGRFLIDDTFLANMASRDFERYRAIRRNPCWPTSSSRTIGRRRTASPSPIIGAAHDLSRPPRRHELCAQIRGGACAALEQGCSATSPWTTSRRC